ncbi:hypothetical protein SODALDRAFT_321436 [Sodiomyces alkalinus F11]|uniref:Uncharacterized protein n=1 Tax=Sodiomyces alkalinus (strain CBS 110278 / VKM F-3762 / F11) TaxID=1314773 RepID=A0A3N2PJA7_SODAK|nr:hypothetical protein SODALDRAFT_321436 [Sodiomyces alkalinus F11]ROT34617.1 hypothetical protein SODALDRAFT_321436 [Sodiomyces alkalinus F11]
MSDPPRDGSAKGKHKLSDSAADSDLSDSWYPREQSRDHRGDPSSLASRIQASASSLLHPEALARGLPDRAEGSSSDKVEATSSTLTSLHKGETSFARSGSSRANEATLSEVSTLGSTAGLGQYVRFLGAQGKAPWVRPSPSSLTTAASAQNANNTGAQKPTTHSDFAQQIARDGAQVAELLASPDPEDAGGDADDVSTALSPQEVTDLRRAFFGANSVDSTEGTRLTSDWHTLLNFQPDFLLEDRSDSIYAHFGVRTVAEADALWLDKWKVVLTNYNDEVWGALEPLAQEARKELGKAGNEQPGRKALSRLRQILAHIRDSK